jgi:hypothetical protein
MFALLRVVCFLCKRRAFSGRFPGGSAFGSHLLLPVSVLAPALIAIPYFRLVIRRALIVASVMGNPAAHALNSMPRAAFDSISACEQRVLA